MSALKRLNHWRYPRSDLNVWAAVLDRFDAALAEITDEYELSKLQMKAFTPETKELVMEILRVERMLLENCTNRKLFSSYDVSDSGVSTYNHSVSTICSSPKISMSSPPLFTCSFALRSNTQIRHLSIKTWDARLQPDFSFSLEA